MNDTDRFFQCEDCGAEWPADGPRPRGCDRCGSVDVNYVVATLSGFRIYPGGPA